MSRYLHILLMLFSCAGLFAQEVRVVEKQADRLRLLVLADVPYIEKTGENDSARSVISFADWPVTQARDGYALPYKPIMLHLNSRHATVRIINAQESRVPVAPPVFFSEKMIGADSTFVTPRANGFFQTNPTADLVTVEYLGLFRQNHLLRAAVFPFRYDATTGELIVYHSILFDIVADPAGRDNSPQQLMALEESERLASLGVFSSTETQAARTVSPRLAKPGADGVEHWKITVNEDGIYRITGRDLAAAGVRLLDIDFKQLRLTSSGRDVSIYADGWRDGQFNDNDYFEFWGEAYNRTFQDRAADMYQDPYTKSRVYWLSWEKRGLWMVEESGEISDVSPGQFIRPYSYLETVHVEEDNYHDPLSNVPIDTLRDHWFFDRGILAGKKVDYTFDLWNPDNQSPLRVSARVMLSGATTVIGSAHDVSLFLNNSFLTTFQWYLQDLADLRDDANSYINGADIKNGPNILSVVNNVNPQQVDNVFLNWYEISYPRLYRAHDDFIKFKIPPDQNGGKFLFRVDGFVDPNVHVYKIHQSKIIGGLVEEVTDLQDFTSLQISFQNDVLYPETEFVAVSNSAKLKPFRIEKDEPSRLKENLQAANYILISHNKFIATPAIDRLIELRQAQGLHVLKVNVQDIYDEFSFGHVSSYALRDFLQWAFEQWPEPRLQHVFLVGDGSYQQISAAGDTLDYIPVHMRQTMNFGAAASDFWYSLLSGDDEIPDINIGRLPVKNTAELEAAIDKMINYEKSPPAGDWPNRFLIIGGNGATFRTQGIALSKIVPPKFDARMLFSLKDKNLEFDPYFGSTNDLIDYLSQGCSVVTFHGHGGGAIWADNNILRLEDVSRFYTQGKLPLILSMTCYTGAFEDPNRDQSLADALLFTPNEGALAMLGASGFGWEWNDYFLQTELMKQVFNNPGFTVGEMITAGKISYLAHYKTTQAVSQVNQYHLLGDPATRIMLPQKEVILRVADPILLHGDNVDVATTTPFVQGAGFFSVEDSLRLIISDAQVNVTNNNANAVLPIDGDFAGESGYIRFYGADDFGNNRVNGAIGISLKGAVFDSAYVSSTPEDSLYFFAHIRSRLPLKRVWCLALNDSLTMLPTGNNWYKSSRAVTVVWTGFQFSYYYYAVDESNQLYTSPLYKHYIGFNVDVAIDQENLIFTGQDLVYLEATINNLSDNNVAKLPVQYEYRIGENPWQTIGIDTVDVAAYATFKSRYPYAPAPGPVTVRVTLDPDSTLTEGVRSNNVLTKTLLPHIFQCTSTGFLLNGERSTTLRFDDHVSVELPAGAITGNAAIYIDTLQQVRITQQPDFLYVEKTPAYDLKLLAPGLKLDKPATLVLNIADSTVQNSLAEFSSLFRFSRQAKKWVKCDTQSAGGLLYADLPDIGAVAVLKATDTQPPEISIAIDGQPYVPGKWASSEPRLGIRLQDINGIDISSGRTEIVLNGRPVDEAELALPDSIVDGNQILISYNPTLLPGEQVLSVRAADCNQNLSAPHDFIFRVAGEFDIQMLGNYPNPFKQDTRFVYIFTGPVSDMSLKVFTASGRMIRNFEEIDVLDDPNPLGADYHEVYWDGADAEGYEVANGIYFYRLSAKTDDKTKTVTGKIAKIK